MKGLAEGIGSECDDEGRSCVFGLVSRLRRFARCVRAPKYQRFTFTAGGGHLYRKLSRGLAPVIRLQGRIAIRMPPPHASISALILLPLVTS